MAKNWAKIGWENWAKSLAEKLGKNWAKNWVEKLGKKLGGKIGQKIGWKNWANNWAEKIGQKIGRILICDHTIIKRLYCAKIWDELMNFIEFMNQWTYGPLKSNNNNNT